MRRRNHLTTIILVLALAIGCGLLAYPSVANWWNNFHQSRAVASYASAAARMDHSEADRMLEEAEAYNEALAESGPLLRMSEEELQEYDKILDITGTGIMGYIDINKIRVKLPVYHGTDPTVLQIAIGHIEGYSLPVGGETSHCVLSGHRGLPSARLFTDLDKLTDGDLFTLTVLDRTLTYEVDQVRIVEPNDLSDLAITEGKDYCTLVTCTPYGINSHRLLVRGHRIANVDGGANVMAEALQIQPKYVAPFIAVPILVLLLVWLLLSTGKGHRRLTMDEKRALLINETRKR